MSGEVEVDVVADVDDGGLVSSCCHLYTQLTLSTEFVGDAGDQVPVVTLVTMTVQETEDDSISSLQQTCLPVEAVVTLLSSVKMIPQTVTEVVQTQLIWNTIDGKSPIFNPL